MMLKNVNGGGKFRGKGSSEYAYKTPLKLKLKGVRKAPSADKALITLNVEWDWQDGSGYQIVFDSDANAIENGDMLTDYPNETMYKVCEYTLPEGATPYENWINAYSAGSVEIPAGIYDFLVINVSVSGDYSYILLPMGDGAVGDNFEFEGGTEYIFTITGADYQDYCTMFKVLPQDVGVVGLVSPRNGNNMTDSETVKATINNFGEEAVTSFTASFCVDGGEVVREDVTHTIPAGETYDYTFKAKADLSAPGMHSIWASATTGNEESTANDTLKVEVYNATPVDAPYSCSFDELGDADEWVILDNNSDNKTWVIDTEKEHCATFDFGRSRPLDDYLITKNPVSLDAGSGHVVITFNGGYVGYYDTFEVLYGKTGDVTQMTRLASVDEFTEESEPRVLSANFDVDEADAYYFAIHATSKLCQWNFNIYDVTIGEGVYAGVPDAVVTKVKLPLASCSLGSEKVEVTILNRGSGAIDAFTLNCSVNGKQASSRKYDVGIQASRVVTLTLDDPVDLSTPGTYTVSVAVADVVPAEGQKQEENLANNTGEAMITHYTPTDLPFNVDFRDESQRGEWSSDESWTYDEAGYQAMLCDGKTPLLSRGINLKAGKMYRMSYDYQAGMDFMGMLTFDDDYRVIIGKDGTYVSAPDSWTTLGTFTDVFTQNSFDTNEITFSVDADGVYQLGFIQDLPQGIFWVRAVRVAEITDYDVMIESVVDLPTRLPKEQSADMVVDVRLSNRGLSASDVKVVATADGTEVGSAAYSIGVGDTATIAVPVKIPEAKSGAVDIELKAEIVGKTDSNMSDNVISKSIELTSNELAYDRVTADMYIPANSISFGTEEGGKTGRPVRIYSKTKLSGISIGWGYAAGEYIDVDVYKYDPAAEQLYGQYMPVGGLVYSMRANNGTATGQIDYMLHDDVELEPGYYVFVVTFAASGLTCDQTLDGKLYIMGEMVETGQSVMFTQPGFGNAAIRVILGDVSTGIDAVEAGSGKAVSVNVSDGILSVDSTEELNGITIYSASGAAMYSESISGKSYTCSVADFAPGVYVAKVVGAGGTVTKKFVVK